MLSKAEVRTLQQAFVPGTKSVTSSSTGATEIVVLSGPIRVFAIGITNENTIANYRFADGTNAPANYKIFLGEIASDGEDFLSLAPGYVRFTDEFRIIRNTAAGVVHWTILYQDE